MVRNVKQKLHEAVNVQGLEQIYNSNYGPFRRIVWFFIFTGGLAFTTFNIYKQVLLYMSTPINVRVDEILGSSLPFPTITICNNNGMKKSFAEKYGAMVTLPIVYPYTDFKEEIPNFNLSDLDAKIQALGVDLGDLMNQSGHSRESTILRCEWEKSPCHWGNFSLKFTDMGICYVFNGNGAIFAQNSGRDYGLRLVLNMEEEEYTRSLHGYIAAGFRVAVHPPEVPAIMSEMGIAVHPGDQHFMGIKVKVHTSQQGISGCGSKKLQRLNANYSREGCRLECQSNYLVDRCKCKDFSIPYNVTFCSAEKYQSCLGPTRKEYRKTASGCESECPEPCSYNTFTTQHSSSPLSRDYITQYTKAKGQTEEHWRRNLVILEVYLSSMTYEHMEKQLGYEIMDLFCDIGGALGLLLGASILTVLEVVDYVCRIALSRIYCKQNEKIIDVK